MEDRKQRALTQRLFLIEAKNIEKHSITYLVSGSTGNIYDVTIKQTPTCSCPDHKTRQNR